MTTNLKLKNKLKSERFQSRKELGSFCAQYDYEKIIAPSQKKKKDKTKGQIKKTYKPQPIPKKISKKKDRQPKATHKPIGHYKSYCKLKRKIQELELDQHTKDKIQSILISETYSDIADNSNDQIYELLENSENIISDSENTVSSDEENNSCICPSEINTLSKDKKIYLEIINKIENLDVQRDYLIQLKDILLKEKQKEKIELYNLKTILNRPSTSQPF